MSDIEQFVKGLPEKKAAAVKLAEEQEGARIESVKRAERFHREKLHPIFEEYCRALRAQGVVDPRLTVTWTAEGAASFLLQIPRAGGTFSPFHLVCSPHHYEYSTDTSGGTARTTTFTEDELHLELRRFIERAIVGFR
jgi:hypothetical protein